LLFGTTSAMPSILVHNCCHYSIPADSSGTTQQDTVEQLAIH
jgi:hypothetical protein